MTTFGQTLVTPPSRGKAFELRTPQRTNFKLWYDRGDLPVRVNGGVHKFVRWHVSALSQPHVKPKEPSFHSAGDPSNDPVYEAAKTAFLGDPKRFPYEVYLPLFFEGLREQGEPYRFLAQQGIAELLEYPHGVYEKVSPCVPLLVLPLRLALNTRDPATVRRAIGALRQLLAVRGTHPKTGASIGVEIAPYYRHLLPIFNLFKSNPKLSVRGDYAEGLVELMDDTLHMMARCGGPGAAQEINRLVPLYHPPPGQRRRP